jgi:hypothetical protein
MNNPRLIFIAALAMATPAMGQDQQTFNVPLSDPGQPVHLEIDLLSGAIEVIGEDRDDVEISVTASGSKRRIVTPSGAKSIPVTSYAVEIEESGNQVEVDSDFRSGPMTVIARVPRNTSVQLDTVHDGNITISNLTGEHELSNVHGPITATGLRGTVIADTVHGAVKVELLEVDPGKAMAFTTVHGDVDLSFPTGFAADVTIESRSEEIYSDFEVVVKPAQPKIRRDDKNKGVSFELEQALELSINGGGTAVRIETLHGEIFLRESAR